MWLAAGNPAPIGLDQVVIAISGLLVAVVTAAAGVVVAIVNSRSKATTPASNTSALDPDDWAFVRERVAVVEVQVRDVHLTDNVQDHRLDRIERHLGLDNEEWHNRPAR